MRCAVHLLLACLLPSTASSQTTHYDLIIRNGRIIDGTGSPWYAGDVGVRDGRIAAVGALVGASARHTIDAAGRIVAPGFIDMLGQSDLSILVNPIFPRRSFRASRPRSPVKAGLWPR